MFQASVPFGSPTFGPALSGLPNLTATGTDLASAYLISASDSVFTNVAPGTGCRLPVPDNQPRTIYNQGANTLLVYPAFGDRIVPFAVGQPISLPPNTAFSFGSFSNALTVAPRSWYVTGGTAGVIGPSTSTPGDLAVFANSYGNLLEDTGISGIGGVITSAVPGVYTNSQMNFGSQFLLGGIDPTHEYTSEQPGNNCTQALVCGALIPSGSTVHEVDGIFSCVATNAGGPEDTTPNAVSGAFYTRSNVAFANLFGLNVLVDDNGLQANFVLGCEWDITGKNVNSIVFGNNMIGVFPNGTPTTSIGYQVAALNAGNPWALAFNVPSGSANIAFQAGAMLTSGDYVNSQPINFTAFDGTGTGHTVGIVAQGSPGGANMVLNTPAGGTLVGGAFLVSGASSFGAEIVIQATPGTPDILAIFQAATTTATTTTAAGSTPPMVTTLALASTSGIGVGNAIAGSSNLVGGTTVATVVDSTHITISLPTIGTIPGGTTLTFSSTANVGSITTNGTSTTYATTSDYRLKEIDGPADGSVIDQLLVYSGVFKDLPDTRRSMLLAHEAQSIAPWAVTGEKDGVYISDIRNSSGAVTHRKGEMIPQQIDHSSFVPDLIAKCQSLQAENAALETEMAQVAATLAALSAQVATLLPAS